MTKKSRILLALLVTIMALLRGIWAFGSRGSINIVKRSFVESPVGWMLQRHTPGYIHAPPYTQNGFFLRTSKRRPMSSLAAALREGDTVSVSFDGSASTGVVKEARGSGWYAVQVVSDEGPTIVKVRASHLSLVAATNNTSASDKTVTLQETPITESEVVIPPPTIVDIDAALQAMHTDPVENKRDLEYLQQCAHHATIEKWVMFTDLHCAPSSLDTCLQILDRAHSEALKRQAGIVFLGDFWHHRATIRIDVLNAILSALKQWTVPMILIPGNHDQVTLGGHNHGLTPLENAYRVEFFDTDGKLQSVPGPLVFSHPTKFANALFVPHIRDISIMESVLRSKASLESKALLIHADVTGAYMNDLIVSQGGVPPSCFPPNIPIYSGHFHKPHVVKSGQVCIDYIGSPYETSLSEAGQNKSLVVLDSEWNCIERIPLHIGRKHFRATSLEELLELSVAQQVNNETLLSDSVVRSGDRVVVTLAKDDLEHMRRRGTVNGQVATVDAQIQALRRAGALVEVNEIASQAVEPLAAVHANNLEEMTPQNTLAAFLQEQVGREALQNDTAEELLTAGTLLLDELEMEQDGELEARNMTDLSLESVTLRGFGPFQETVTYPLLDRGLVLLRGMNKDGGADSNGSGKTSLAMATLWALTGQLDPRPMQDAKVADVVNDDCKSAKVTVRGTLNGKEFVISRLKTSSKGALAFYLGGEDLTAQSVKETQTIIDEKLGVGSQIIARTMFHGQFSMNGLLEATDTKLKEELSLVVPLSLWQRGTSLARAKSREASKKAAEFKGMISLRSSDLDDLKKRRDEAQVTTANMRSSFESMEAQMKQEIRELWESATSSPIVDIQQIQNGLDDASTKVQELERQMEDVVVSRDTDLAILQDQRDEAAAKVALSRDELQSKQSEHERAVLKLESARSHIMELEKKWNLDIASGSADIVPPQICPTCQQPIADSGVGHSHEELWRIMKNEVEAVAQAFGAAEIAAQEAHKARDSAARMFDAEEKRLEESLAKLEEAQSIWTSKMNQIERELVGVRHEQSSLSTQLSDAAKNMQQEAHIQAKESALSDERKNLEASTSVYWNLCNSVEEAKAGLQELRRSGEEQRSRSVTMTNLADVFGQRGVQSFILHNTIEALESVSQSYLNELSDGSQRLELSLDTGDRISRRALIRSQDGTFTERPMSSLSGGQWRRCSLALSLGFADLVARRGRMKTSLCVLDEPLTHLDRSGRSRVGQLLRGLLRQDGGGVGMSVSTIILILQDLAAEELEESFDHIDEVVKESGVSSVSVDEQS